jgi:hypothetical protein
MLPVPSKSIQLRERHESMSASLVKVGTEDLPRRLRLGGEWRGERTQRQSAEEGAPVRH